MTDAVFLVIGAVFSVGCGVAVYHYGKRRVLRAKELKKQGWREVGFDFLHGPIMAPPLDATQTAPAKSTNGED